MSQPLLSILIPLTPDRWEDVKQVCKTIFKQTGSFPIGLIGQQNEIRIGVSDDGLIELITFTDDKVLSIGDKRERLYQMANGMYSWQIDSDDDISDDAIKLILEAITQNPDCITFQEYVNINGVIEKSNHSLEYDDWEGQGGVELWDGFHYHRTPFMKSVIKTEIARSVPIPHIRFGEDHEFAKKLKHVLKSEIHIPQEVYYYQHTSTPHNERYGITG
jgi:hypothetical protein